MFLTKCAFFHINIRPRNRNLSGHERAQNGGASEVPMEDAPENATLGAIKVLETTLIDKMTVLLKPVHDN